MICGYKWFSERSAEKYRVACRNDVREKLANPLWRVADSKYSPIVCEWIARICQFTFRICEWAVFEPRTTYENGRAKSTSGDRTFLSSLKILSPRVQQIQSDPKIVDSGCVPWNGNLRRSRYTVDGITSFRRGQMHRASIHRGHFIATSAYRFNNKSRVIVFMIFEL